MVVILGWRLCRNSFIDVSGLRDLTAQKRIGKVPTSQCRDPVPNPGTEPVKQYFQTVSLIFHQCIEESGFAESITLI